MSTVVSIITKAKDDTTPALPNVEIEKNLLLKNVIILEGFTSQGKTGVTLHLQDTDGKNYLASTTGNMFNALAHGLRGAAARFGEELK